MRVTCSQALEARAQGLAEVCNLLQQPEDLDKLSDMIYEYESKLKASKTGLESLVQSQVRQPDSQTARQSNTRAQAAAESFSANVHLCGVNLCNRVCTRVWCVQVEAVRMGLESLDRAHRHVLKLRASLDTIFK